MRTRAALLVLGLGVVACGGPVRSTHCEIVASPAYGSVLRAVLTNDSDKPVTHVGVFVQRAGVEYEFPVRLEAHRSTPVILGTPYGGPTASMTRAMLGPISDEDCWARAVEFADGTVWSASPL